MGIDTHMNEVSQEFEKVVMEAFKQQGFAIETSINAFDFSIIGEDKKKIAVEVKYYRSQFPKLSLIMTAAQRLVLACKDQNFSKAILVVSASLSVEEKLKIEEQFQITVADRADLFNMTRSTHITKEKLQFLLEIQDSEEISESLSKDYKFKPKENIIQFYSEHQ